MRGSSSSRMRNLLLRAVRAFGGFSLAQRLTRSRLRILCYHGLSQGDEHLLLPYMFIRPETFESRLRILKRRGIAVLTLDEAVRKLTTGELDRSCAVLTFDDGWASNLSLGLPILNRYGCPACIYVTTEHLDGEPEAFNVILLYLLLRSKSSTLTLSGLHPALDGTYDVQSDPHTTVRTLAQLTEAAIPLSERPRLLEPIAKALALDLREVLHDGRFRLLDRHELKQLAQHDAIAVELHTHTHRLPDQSFQAMAREIEDNRHVLRELTGREARHFCYPSGLHSAQHPDWLRQLGILSATTCEPGLNGKHDSVMLLRRYLDNDQTSDIVFEAQVCGLHHILQSVRRTLRRPPSPS
jgi:peptidoglycan/xylan/chitin deacetylase (PgdA/CDA1 family)